VSSDLENRLREGRATLPEPDVASTERARERALAAAPQRPSRRGRTAAALAAILAAALLAVSFAGASFLREPVVVSQPKQSRVIDRTFLCTHRPYGGFPEIEARAHEGVRIGGTTQLPYAVVAHGPYAAFAWITAGALSRDSVVEMDQIRRKRPPATAAVSTEGCNASTARVPLSAAGLSRSGAGPFGDDLDCRSGPRFRLRIRAVLTRPGALTARRSISPGSLERRPFLMTNVPIRAAGLAVRTESGKPLVYAEVFNSGKVRLFTANGCVHE
jgi:hypothetical protein